MRIRILNFVLVPAILLVLVGAGCVNTVNSDEKVRIDELNKKVEDMESARTKDSLDLIRHYLVLKSLLSNQLVDIMNQYDLGQDSTCEQVKNRLGSIKRSYNLFDSSEEKNQSFTLEIKGLKEANKEYSNRVKNLDYIEFCLNQIDADINN